jgi:DNA-binding response OmpR family regulator
MDAIQILVVEDDPDIAEVLTESLADEGFQVELCITAEDALEKLSASNSIRAVLTDIRLPGDKDGWDVGHAARAAAPAMPVVYISGDRADLWRVKGVPNSIMVQKPFVLSQIITALATVLNDR